MRKLNLFIFLAMMALITLSGCGMPGPLYQTPDEKPTGIEQSQEVTDTQEQETP